MCALHHDLTSSVIIFYHSNCHDGHMSAFTLWCDLHNQTKVKVDYYPVNYGTTPPDVTGKIVYILDFSFPCNILKLMISQAEALLIIDHHKTAQENLDEIPDKYKIFDMNECGATLTWKYLYPDKPLPLAYNYIRSRDLWTHDMKDTDAFYLAFEIAIRNEKGKYDFNLTEKYLIDKEVENLLNIGKVLKVYHDTLVEKTLSNIYFCPIRRDDQLLIVAYVNVTAGLASDVGAQCMKNYTFVDFCACYHTIPINQKTIFSLRSRDGCQDVSVIARDHGGGGHRNSSSCLIDKITCFLNYEHLNPWPLWCMHTNRKLEIPRSKLGDFLTPDYLQLLQLRFPGKTLQIDLNFTE